MRATTRFKICRSSLVILIQRVYILYIPYGEIINTQLYSSTGRLRYVRTKHTRGILIQQPILRREITNPLLQLLNAIGRYKFDFWNRGLSKQASPQVEQVLLHTRFQTIVYTLAIVRIPHSMKIRARGSQPRLLIFFILTTSSYTQLVVSNIITDIQCKQVTTYLTCFLHTRSPNSAYQLA